MTAMPTNENSIPIMFDHVILSLAVKNAANGVKTGIVAMITELMVGEEYFNPKFSPRKYRKGLKKAETSKSFRSSLRIFSYLPVNLTNANNIPVEISNRRKMVVMGL
jgi:hypothetical protein